MKSDWVVLKFGGTSVASRQGWDVIAGQVRDRLSVNEKPFLVFSAFAGVSDLLEEIFLHNSNKERDLVLDQIACRHQEIAKDLGVDNECYAEMLEILRKKVDKIKDVSPKLKADIFAYGEILSTTIGAEFLKSQIPGTLWIDARDILKAINQEDDTDQRSYLLASCDYEPDEKLQKNSATCIVTQGFIASNDKGKTVLLGRGGSDVSASYFAAKLSAKRLEIWTDVPGLFTADPRYIGKTRLLKHLNYDEAQEIVTLGAKVLHPRSVTPVKQYHIPLHIRSTLSPEMSGTIISVDAISQGAEVKAISSRKGITVVSMNTIEMWQRVGFLADVFTTFRKHGLSIDLVSTSETNVTVTLDQTTGAFDDKVLKALTKDLSKLCDPRIIPSCATVSLVGNNIRTILHHLAPTLEVFEEKQIYLVSQAANDLNLTFVVDEAPADKLVSELHAQIFSSRRPDAVIGPSWEELFEKDVAAAGSIDPWWIEQRDRLLEMAAQKTPQFVYNKGDVEEKIEALKGCSSLDRRLYSIKANIYPPILKLIRDAGFGFECVSPGEVEYLFNEFSDMKPEEILFTPNFAPKGDYEVGLNRGVQVTIDSLHPLIEWPELFKGKEIFVRLDPGEGKGHHKFVHTAGVKAKFGIPPSRFGELAKRAKKSGAAITGLHAHVGSSIHDPFVWEKTASFLSKAAEHFPEAKVLDLGGGLGVVEKPGQPPLDLERFNEALGKFKKTFPQFKLWIEPGRFLVAEAGILLARVTQTKIKGDYHFVGVDVGMNTLIRPALYGSHHDIVNLSRLDEEATIRATVVGPICESGDVLGYARDLPNCYEGDVLLIGTAGAYGRVMSSNYNLRSPASEYFIETGKGDR